MCVLQYAMDFAKVGGVGSFAMGSLGSLGSSMKLAVGSLSVEQVS